MQRQNLIKKVNNKGAFLPFYGNTVVFDLDEAAKKALLSLQEELYKNAGWMLSQRIDPAAFHMTLHDLVNAPELTDDLKCRMQEAEVKAKSIMETWKGQTPHITMAYFMPGTYTQYDLNCLRRAMRPVELEVELRVEDLHYQVFQDMNHYENK